MKNYGFTLAEVLITLGIIGVVSAITMPVLINNFQEKVTITRLKQAYSILSQAYTNITANEGSADTWNLENADKFRDLFANYIKNVKKCDVQTDNCQPQATKYLHSSGEADYNNYKNHSNLIMNNGTLLTFYLNPARYDNTCSSNYGGINDGCKIAIHIDINGKKEPNTWGKDRFEVMIYKNKILPAGHPDMTVTSFQNNCLKDSGEACTAWVIYNENLDYLKCPEILNWTGKTSCK